MYNLFQVIYSDKQRYTLIQTEIGDIMNKIKYIDPMIGTVGEVEDEVCHGGGKTYPGVALPGGMVQLSPDTVTGGDNGTGYNYCHDTIEGFSFNHMSGIGWYGDLGNIQIMPIIGETSLRSGSNKEIPFTKGGDGWKSPFSHENEKAGPGYYSVYLDKNNILAEATATMHTGILRFTYPEADDAGIILNFSRRIGGKADFQHIDIIDNRHIEGYIKCTPKGGGFGRGHGNISYTLYFYLELSKAPKEMQFFSNEEYCEKASSFEGEDVGLLLRFDTKESEKFTINCGISYTDIDGARKNFNAEYTDFDTAVKSAEEAWNGAFNCIDVDGENRTDLTLFYTCLYHVLLDPRIASDIDGRFKTADGKVKKVDYIHRTMFSGWDVYRSEFPLLTLIKPDIVNDEINSLLNIALEKNSSLPKWELMGIDAGCMVGDPGLIVMADAYSKGIRNFDFEKAYEIAKASSLSASTLYGKSFYSVRPKTPQYLEKSVVAESLSETLEFLLADYTMYKIADISGRKDDAEYFLNRAKRYKENYDSKLGFLNTKDENGNFIYQENEYDDDGCVESNIFQQTWFVPYDVEGLSELFGGKERTLELLERLFSKADLTKLWNDDYNHSNEPCHNITHYFNILGQPDHTQYWTRRVQKEAYRLGAFGFCGNEDVGQLSAWYVLSALGFAQICPADPKYYINTPLFTKAEIKLNNDYHSCSISDRFVIQCDKNPLDYLYIKEIFLNNRKIERTYLTYDEITSGGTLNLILTNNKI